MTDAEKTRTKIKITVKTYMTLPEKLGWREKVLEYDHEPTLSKVLEDLPDLKNALEEYEKKGFPAVIMVNGRRIEFLAGMNTILRDRDEISVFPPAAGG